MEVGSQLVDNLVDRGDSYGLKDSVAEKSAITRRLAAGMLFCAVMFQIVAFLVVFSYELYQFFGPVGKNIYGQPYASGHNNWPSSVSEQIYDPLSPAGQIFRAASLCIAICLMVSAYPWRLRNVYLGAKSQRAQLFHLVRHMAPPLGLIILSQTPSSPTGISTPLMSVNASIHGFGAIAMFGAYIVTEAFTLCSLRHSHIGVIERRIRWFWQIGMILAAPVFLLLINLSDNEASLGICCPNLYEVPNLGNISGNSSMMYSERMHPAVVMYMNFGQPALIDTARGPGLALNIASYLVESTLGMLMCGSMLTIWYFCPERQFKLPKELPLTEEYPKHGDFEEVELSEDDEDDGFNESA